MDDLLALFAEEEQNQQEQQIELAPPITSSNNENRNNAAGQPITKQQQKQQQQTRRDEQLSASVDNKVGIRMINRKICSTDLLDMISESESEYQSPAALSAMSLESLNRILLSPAAVLDPATVCGRTRILTVGLVFSNSGTRFSRAGNGFCALTVGSNLASGPAITVLLFGSAYHRFVKIAKPGKVIALMNPRLVPTKQQQSMATGWQKSSTTAARNDMAQTFSLNDEQQIRLVADARDFAFCKATVAARNENGKWVPNAKRCTKHVDSRIGEYCHTHRKQALVKDGSDKRGAIKGGLVAQLRMEARAFPSATKLSLAQNSMVTQLPLAPSQLAAQLALERSQACKSRELSLLSSSSSSRRTALGTNLRTFSTTTTTQQVPTENSILNPYNNNAKTKATILKCPSGITVTPQTRRDNVTMATTKRVTNDWLQEATSKKVATATKPRRRTINTDSAQFDGSVAIPKPSQMFTRNARGTAVAAAAGGRVTMAPVATAQNKTVKSAQDILLQQKQVAAQLRDPTSRHGPAQLLSAKRTTTTTPTTTTTTQPSKSTNREDLLFGSLGDFDRDEILRAKSRFSQEVDAQEYARARQSVTELEFEEARKDAAFNNKKKKNGIITGAIQKEWHCVNCRRSYSNKPNRCYTLNHTVKIRRSIEQSKSIAEKRQELSDKNAKDGGLTLGQGLDWSRWNRFSS